MEQVILSHLLNNEIFVRKVIPYIKEEYFSSDENKKFFQMIEEHLKKYNNLPTKEILCINLDNQQLTEETHKNLVKLIDSLSYDPQTKTDWLIDQTEKFCQDKALYNAIKQSIVILDKDNAASRGNIPKILQEALQISFDNNVGHDFLEKTGDRYDFYHTKENRLPFSVDLLNKISGGGLPAKTLSCYMASTGVGKSLIMCNEAAYNLRCNKNVLYITLEMSEERIAQRIDANLLDITLDDLMLLSKKDYVSKFAKFKEHNKGRLIIKEYPTASAGVNHFRHLLTELKIKKNFIADVIYIDYINLCISSRNKAGSNINSYSYIKSIAEEMRGLAVEHSLPIVTATQGNRGSVNSSDMDMDSISDSFGTAMTMDFLIGVMSTEELAEMNQYLFKQLKNRFGDPTRNKRFLVGVDRSKMKLYNIESSEQDIMEGPVMDNTDFGIQENDRNKKFDKSKFKGFN